MSESLERKRAIDPSKLNRRAYFLSLTTQAHSCGLLSDGDLSRLEAESLALLAQKAKTYVGGESTSIRAETAHALLESIQYTIGIALKTCVLPEDAVERLCRESLDSIEASGQALISRRLDTVRLLHARLKQRLFDSENVFYQGTIVDGIDGFLRSYRPAFFAQETHITADYPPLNTVDGTGIEFVEAYLRAVTHENRFLLYFPPERVRRLLTAQNEAWRLTPMNLVEPVLTAAILCDLCGRPPRNLFCTAQDVTRAVCRQSERRLWEQFSQAFQRLTSAFKCPPGLTTYLRRALPSVTANAEATLREGGAERLAFGAPVPEICTQTVLPLGERMPDAVYARFVKQLTQYANAEDRASRILRDAHSPADLFDVLRDVSPGRECLFHVFAALPEALLAALCKQYPAPELLTDERERTLCEALSDYLAQLSPDKRAHIEAAARSIRLEP